ncbi:MAG: prepilin-type N-terminal cleavage/methylation domain-containing protein [Proteobacteria bacterium]|nr:prepilin-type N-terminal cleavage/methylation domain-containing protein [Pseudomonadota bacterium]
MKNNKGFTLIEIVLVIILIGIIAGFVGGILFQETRFFSLLTPRKEINLENKLIFERILKELKYAYQNSYTTGSDVRFKIPYSLLRNYTSVRFFLSNNKLYLSTNSTTAQIIGDNVTFFNVTSLRWQPNRDLVRLRVSHSLTNSIISLETAIFLRNKR